MSLFAKVFSIVVALYPFATAADCANGAASCVEEYDATSLIQVKKVPKQGSDRVKENSQSPKVLSDTANSTLTSLLALQSRVEFSVMQVVRSIDHCFQKRGLGLEKQTEEPLNVYMHSGTAVNYLGCRKKLNDIDLWVPAMMQVLPPDKKVPLLQAFGEGPGVKWDFAAKNSKGGFKNPLRIPGLTDKGVEEHPDQTYCPEEVIDGRTFKEVDAFVGTGKVRVENGGNVYPKFDIKPFNGIASKAVANAVLVYKAIGFHLYVIGTCDLIALKVALINGGRKNPKLTDAQDVSCLCQPNDQQAKCNVCPFSK